MLEESCVAGLNPILPDLLVPPHLQELSHRLPYVVLLGLRPQLDGSVLQLLPENRGGEGKEILAFFAEERVDCLKEQPFLVFKADHSFQLGVTKDLRLVVVGFGCELEGL